MIISARICYEPKFDTNSASVQNYLPFQLIKTNSPKKVSCAIATRPIRGEVLHTFGGSVCNSGTPVKSEEQNSGPRTAGTCKHNRGGLLIQNTGSCR